MSDLAFNFSLFHFIRPWMLIPVPLILLLWWRVRRPTWEQDRLPEGLAPHLAEALSVGSDQRSKILPIDAAALFMILGALAAAGPTWSRVPNPLVAQTAPMAVVLEVSKSMEKRDIAPSRLERAKHKILDLLDRRAGARTALIAYADTAHRVVPLSEDPEVLKPFLEGLSPEVMPKDGANAGAALEAAVTALAAEKTPGAILFVADSVDQGGLTAFRTHAESGGVPILVLAVTKTPSDVDAVAGVQNVSVVELTTDTADVSAIERRAAQAYREALDADDRQKWDDRGWLLAWPAALLVLLWFRRGWTMRWSVALVVAASLSGGGKAQADGLVDWFLTPDQQGRLAWQDKRFGDAADLFADPAWKGYALYRAGRYPEAIEVLSQIDTADAAVTLGMSHIKSRGYRPAIEAFETALERDPDNATAQRNLELARVILTYVEETREASDTGEESGIGADDVVFDNEAGKGTDTEIEAQPDGEPGLQSAEQWMRSVDTQTKDFLRSRFLLEASRRQE